MTTSLQSGRLIAPRSRRSGATIFDTLKFVTLLLLAGTLTACSGALPEESPESTDLDANELASSDQELHQSLIFQRHFTVTRDLRKCVFPLCGGYFVDAVNRVLTRCADGTLAQRCYVASIDWSRLGGDPGLDAATVVLEGTIKRAVYPGFGNLGVFVAEHAWGSATKAEPTGVYLGLHDNGIVCVTEPCFSIDARVLNHLRRFQLSNLDFSAVGASDKQLELAQQALLDGNLLATGKTRRVEFPAGTGVELRASQFFLPAPEPPRCFSDADCKATEHCNAAEICLPPPGCNPGDACADVCTGFCVPL